MLKRKNEIKIRLTDDELAMLNKNVSKCNMSRERYIRNLINGNVPCEAPPAQYYDLICEVRRSGSNINQLLKIANITGALDADKVKSTLENNRYTEQMLWKAFAPTKVKT